MLLLLHSDEGEHIKGEIAKCILSFFLVFVLIFLFAYFPKLRLQIYSLGFLALRFADIYLFYRLAQFIKCFSNNMEDRINLTDKRVNRPSYLRQKTRERIR